MVEVPPAVAPDLAALGPAVGVAGEQELEALGEAGFAGAVAADDEGEAGAGGEIEGGFWADAAEALGGDAAEEGGLGLVFAGCLGRGLLGFRLLWRGLRWGLGRCAVSVVEKLWDLLFNVDTPFGPSLSLRRCSLLPWMRIDPSRSCFG